MAITLDSALLAFARLVERYEGIPPTVREVGDELGVASTSAAAHWLNTLEEDGLIYCPPALKEMTHSTARNRKLTPAGERRARSLALPEVAANIRQSEGWS